MSKTKILLNSLETKQIRGWTSSNTVNILIIDSSLNYIIVSKVFKTSFVNIYNNYPWVVLYNNMFIITESGPMKGLQNSTISNIIFHKASLDYNSMSNEIFSDTNSDLFTTGYQSKRLETGFIFENSSIGYFIKLIILMLKINLWIKWTVFHIKK